MWFFCLHSSGGIVWVPASTRWCRLRVREPQQQGRCLTPSPFLTPPSQPLPRGEHSPCCIACLHSSSFPAPGSFIYLLLSTVFVQASRGLDKPAVQTRCSAVAVRGENCKEAPGQTSALSFLPPLLSCTTLAPLSIRLARKTRHVGAALQGLPQQRGLEEGTSPLLHAPLTPAGWHKVQTSSWLSPKIPGKAFRCQSAHGVQTCVTSPAVSRLSC